MSRTRTALLWIPTALALVLGGFVLATYRADLPLPMLVDKYTNEASEFVDVDGMRVHFRDEGRGDVPLLLLHGTGASLHTWDGWLPPLQHDFRIVRLDLPGFGLTGPAPDGDYRVQAYVEFLGHFADRLGLDRFHLAGNSLGGQIAWHFAIANPHRVRKLVLLDAAGFPGNDKVNDSLIFQLSRIPVVSHMLENLTPRGLIESSLREVYGNPSKISDALIDRYFELARRPGNRRAFIARAAAASSDSTRDPADISQPTLILWGGDDRWIPLADARGFAAAIADSRLIVYPGVGHVPMEELPGPTARATLTFLDD